MKLMPGMTTPELKEFIKEEDNKGDNRVPFYKVEQYRRTAMPAAIIILVFVAVTIARGKCVEEWVFTYW